MMDFNRRDFIRFSGLATGGAAILPHLLWSCNRVPLSDTAEGYLNHFEVTRESLQKVLAAAMSRGADYADLFFEHTRNNTCVLEDGKVDRTFSGIDFGVGIRVIKGEQTGYGYSETVDPEAMLQAARAAANIADGKQSASTAAMTEFAAPSFYPVKNSWEKSLVKDKIPFMQRMNDTIFAADKRVSKVTVYLADTSSYILFYNSEGTLAWDSRPMVLLYGLCTMEENGRIENFGVNRSYRMGTEFLTNELVDELSKEAVQKTAVLFTAEKPKPGEMEVVTAAGESGILLHEAMGHSFEADFNRKKLSIFCDRMGKKVAENFVSIIDDGTLPGNRGSLNFDDEGNPAEKTVLVNKGALTSYLHDRISANYYKVKPTGNGRRETFRHIPIPRMRSTYMENGPHKRDEIIASVKKGLFVESFSNGQVNIGQGDFTFFVKFGYLIEDGKLTKPVKDVNLIGNGPQALLDITMVADDMQISNGAWTCGKNGQGAPVTMGIPTVKIRKLTVG